MREQQLLSFVRLGKILLMIVIVYFIIHLKAIWLPIFDLLFTAIIPFAIAGFITYLLHPLIENIHERGIPRALAVLIIYIIFFGGIGYGLYKGIPLFIQQLKDLSGSLPQLAETYRDWTKQIHNETSAWPEEIHMRVETLLTQAEQSIGNLLTKVLNGLKGFINSAIVFALIPFIVFYMLKDIEQMKKAVWYMTPKRWRSRGLAFLKDVDESLGNYIRGQLFVCLVIGTMATVALWMAGMKYPLLLGMVIGATNIIPYFGPVIGAVPAVILAATISLKMVAIVVVIIFGLQFLEGNILSPFIVGKSLHMHPLVIMLALFIGGEIGGVTGLILAVPVAAVLKVALLHAKVHFRTH
ncbi:putative PurR-regulated permease PerM [Anoxybacillus vitaminiphilus]|uniref:Putative PurR-regulated permease PerM n=1 Tax=Paranoxybacillus vitaminiphilus TaxID=581036 RepID=A0A327YA79_9BACL|nr:AI-2E family transporter [Anoxybacillus vitaminiphilus]RAK17331.1 putative PurR-regulated permease PerM [Anoxybacillus vitaminiphilus]